MQCTRCRTMLSPGMKNCPTCGLSLPPNLFSPLPNPPRANATQGQSGLRPFTETVPPSPRAATMQSPPMMQRPPSPLPTMPSSPNPGQNPRAAFPPVASPNPIVPIAPTPAGLHSNMAPPQFPASPLQPSPFPPQQQIMNNNPFAAAPSPVPLPPEERVQRYKDNSSTLRLLYIGLIIVFLITSGGLGYYIYRTQYAEPSQVKAHLIATSKVESKANATSTAIGEQNATATSQAIAKATAAVNAKATAVVVGTATALHTIYVQATAGAPAINDSLTANTANNWGIFNTQFGDNCTFTGGAMHLTSTHSAVTLCPEFARSYTDFAFQVNLSFNLGDTAGLMYRYQSSTLQFYAFIISPSGTFAVSLLQLDPSTGDLTNSTVLTSGASQAINLGMNQTNQVSVVVRGGGMWFYVNQTCIAYVNNTSLGGGLVGVAAGSSKGAYSDVSFTKAQLWTLP